MAILIKSYRLSVRFLFQVENYIRWYNVKIPKGVIKMASKKPTKPKAEKKETAKKPAKPSTLGNGGTGKRNSFMMRGK